MLQRYLSSDVIRIGFVLLIVTVVYSPVVQNRLIGDDLLFREWSEKIVTEHNIGTFFVVGKDRPAGKGFHAVYRPIINILMAPQALLFGDFYPGYRVVSLLYRLSAILLFYVFLRRYLLPDIQEAAFVGALIFGLHSAYGELICFISGQDHSLVIAFGLAMVLLHARFRETGSTPWKSGWFWSAVFMALLSAFTNDLGVTFAGLIVAYDLVFCRPDRRRFVEYGATWAIYGATAAIFIAAKLALYGTLGSYGDFTIGMKIRSVVDFMIFAEARYLTGVDVINTMISSNLPFLKLTPLSTAVIVAVWVLGPAGIIAALLWRHRRSRAIQIGMLWMLITAVILNGRVWGRHTGFFSVGFAAVAAALFVAIPRGFWKRIGWTLLVVMAVYHAALIQRTIAVHHDAGELVHSILLQTRELVPAPAESLKIVWVNVPAETVDPLTRAHAFVELTAIDPAIRDMYDRTDLDAYAVSRVVSHFMMSPETEAEFVGPRTIRVHSSEGFQYPPFRTYPRIGETVEYAHGLKAEVVETSHGLASTLDLELSDDEVGADVRVVFLKWNSEGTLERLEPSTE